MTDLHETILALQPREVMRGGLGDSYRTGFEEARHAAAELARAALSAPPGWIVTKDQKPRGGQLIVKRWKNGAVWAGTHDEGPKNESFDWWLPLPAAPYPQEQTP